jgi:hypothetical protein
MHCKVIVCLHYGETDLCRPPRAIEQLKLHDFADLVIALGRNDLDLPRPADTPLHAAQVAQAAAILQPRLRHGG